MQELLTHIKTKYHTLSIQQKQAVYICAALLSILTIYQCLWSPYLHHIAAMRNELINKQNTLLWMQTADKEIEANKSKVKQTPAIIISSLQNEIRNAGLEKHLVQLKPQDDKTVALRVQKIEFDKLMNVLIAVSQTQHIKVKKISLLANEPGTVSGELILE